MRKTDRKRETKPLQVLQGVISEANQVILERIGANAPVLGVERSENIRWNRALFHLQVDGSSILEDRTVEEIHMFLNGALFLNKICEVPATEPVEHQQAA